MASCEEEQEKTKAAEGLKLRLELERRHSISCHDLIESGLEIERIYSFLLEELMDVEEDKMKEMESRISTSREHSKVLVKESATKINSSSMASRGGCSSSSSLPYVVVIEDNEPCDQVTVFEPSRSVTTTTQSPSKEQQPKMKNFSLVISKASFVVNEESNDSQARRRHQVCTPQKQGISSPLQANSPQQSNIKSLQQPPKEEVEVEEEINVVTVTSESEATSPEIPMQNKEDSFLHIRPRRYRRLIDDSDEEQSFIKESPRKLTTGNRLHQKNYSSFDGFKPHIVRKERAIPSQRTVAPPSPTNESVERSKKRQPRHKDKVTVKPVTQLVKAAKETTTASSSSSDEASSLPKRKRRNQLEDKERTRPLQRTRARTNQTSLLKSKRQEDEELEISAKEERIKPQSKHSALPKRKVRKEKVAISEENVVTEPPPASTQVDSPQKAKLRNYKAPIEKQQDLEKKRGGVLSRYTQSESLTAAAAEPRSYHHQQQKSKLEENEVERESSKSVEASSPLSAQKRKTRSPRHIVRRDYTEQKGEEEEVESLTLANTILLLSPLRERMLKARKEEAENGNKCTKVAERSVVEMEGSKRRKNRIEQEETQLPTELRSSRRKRDTETLPAAAEQPPGQVTGQTEERSEEKRIKFLRPPKQIPTRLIKAGSTFLDHTSLSSASFAKGRRTLLSSTQASCIMDSMMSTFCEQDHESKTRRPSLRVSTKGFTTPHLRLSQREKSK